MSLWAALAFTERRAPSSTTRTSARAARSTTLSRNSASSAATSPSTTTSFSTSASSGTTRPRYTTQPASRPCPAQPQHRGMWRAGGCTAQAAHRGRVLGVHGPRLWQNLGRRRRACALARPARLGDLGKRGRPTSAAHAEPAPRRRRARAAQGHHGTVNEIYELSAAVGSWLIRPTRRVRLHARHRAESPRRRSRCTASCAF